MMLHQYMNQNTARNLNSQTMNSNEDWYQTAIKKFEINEISYKELSEEQNRIGSGG